MGDIKNVLGNKCPNCSKGSIFQKNNSWMSFRFPKMNHSCKECGFVFEKEPGFFYGAMYVSYGLGVAEGLAIYFLIRPFFKETFDLKMFPVIAMGLLLLTFYNYKLSRIIWIYIFKNYKK